MMSEYFFRCEQLKSNSLDTMYWQILYVFIFALIAFDAFQNKIEVWKTLTFGVSNILARSSF